MLKGTKRVFIVLTVIVTVVMFMCIIDYIRVNQFLEPLFTISYEGDDYMRMEKGCGYSVLLRDSNNDEYPGITEFRFYLFGHEIAGDYRD